MREFKGKELYAFLIFINITFMLNILEICYKIADFDYVFSSAIFVIAMSLYSFYSTVLDRKFYKWIVILSVLIAISGFCYYQRVYVQSFGIRYLDELYYLNQAIYNYEATEFVHFKIIFIVFISIISILLEILSAKGLGNSMILMNTVVILLFWYGNYTEEIKKILSIYLLVSVFTYGINNHLKKIRELNLQGIRVAIDIKGTITSLLVLAVLMTVATKMLPQEYKGKYNSEMVGRFVNKFNEVQGDGTAILEKRKYDLASSGYSNNDKHLGGPIVLNNNLVFKVRSDKPYYLRGSVKDFYDGSSWKQSKAKYINQDLVENDLASFLAYLGLERKKIEIDPTGAMSTSTLFSPNFSTGVQIEKGDVFIEEQGLTFQNSIISTKPYTIEFYGAEEDLSLLKNLQKKQRITRGMNYDSIGEQMTEQYLQLPNNDKLQRVSELAQEITKNSNNNFEKVQKIEKYLNATYTYSINVSPIPKGEDFLTYFLFKEKKGYCTYFATATVLLCRMVDIPARYVEGFKMSSKTTDEGLYMVTNEDAHAWAEVLVMPKQGIWGIVDPSPTATEQRQKEEEERKLKEVEQQIDIGNTGITNKEKKIEEEEGTFSGDSFKLKLSSSAIRIMEIIGGIIFWVGIRGFFIWKKKKKILDESSSIPLYVYTMKRLSRINIKKLEHEGDMEFIEGIKEEELKERMREFIPLVYEEFYGKNKIRDFDKKAFYVFIERYIKKRQGKVKYFSKIFILWQ